MANWCTLLTRGKQLTCIYHLTLSATWNSLPDVGVGSFGANDSLQQSLAIIKTSNGISVLVAGRTGLYLNFLASPTNWYKIVGVPSAFIYSVRYDTAADVAYVSTLGRGVWAIHNARTYLDFANKPSLDSSAQPKSVFEVLTYIFAATAAVLFVVLIFQLVLLVRRSTDSYSTE